MSRATSEGSAERGVGGAPAGGRDGLSVSAAAAAAPEHPALISGTSALTWREVAERVARLLAEPAIDRAAKRSGSGGAVAVALVGRRDVATALWILALLERRLPFVLLHPRWTDLELQAAVAAAGCGWSIDGEEIATLRSAAGRGTGAVADGDPSRGPALDDCACVLFTSGTTGAPRAAVLSRSALLAAAAASERNLGWRPEDRWLLNLPLAHVGGLSVLTRCLAARRTVVVDEGSGFEAADLLRGIERHRVTLASLVPTMLQRTLAAGGTDSDETGARRPPSCLRAVLLGGARAAPQLVDRARRAGWPVLLTYGMTETCAQLATQSFRDLAPGLLRSDTVGRPLAGLEVRLRPVDGEGGGDGVVGPGEVGAVEVRGASLFSGYLGVPVDQTFAPGGWFDTGDFARFDSSGELALVDRRSDLVVTGGENVYPSEVEAALLAVDGVLEACVAGLDDPEWGQRVGCAVVLESGIPVDRVRASLAGRLAGFKTPRVWVVVDALPRIGLGKVDRRGVARLLAQSTDG